MHKVRTRTTVEDWSWEVGKRASPGRDNRSPLEFPLRLSDEQNRYYVCDLVPYVASRSQPLFLHTGLLPRRLSLQAITVAPEDKQLYEPLGYSCLSMTWIRPRERPHTLMRATEGISAQKTWISNICLTTSVGIKGRMTGSELL